MRAGVLAALLHRDEAPNAKAVAAIEFDPEEGKARFGVRRTSGYAREKAEGRTV